MKSLLAAMLLVVGSGVTGAAWAQQEETGAAADMAADAPESADAATDEVVTDDATADDVATAGETTTEEGAEDDAVDVEAADTEEVAADLPAPSRFQPVMDLIEAGGWIIIILLGLSVISLMVILVKIIQFRILRVGDYKFTAKVSALLQEGKADEAMDFLARRRGIIPRVMETALRGKLLGGHDDAAREETERVAKAKLDGLERGLPLLNLIATVSPLLGLLGTVLGMIEAFQQLETAGDRVDPAILSGGIWEALLTTAAGLTVAIPAAAFFTWLQRSVDVAAQHMEDAAVRVFTSSLYGAVDEAETGEDDA